ncbi:glycosyltransferase family 2 protein [Hydrogenophaga sp. NFH-34]|uniref:glycosyltransferase family 2 protein n=1 Tax=Hydrogenophaga sp. NFH-34 TaxID=2744446 RepID=UPI001F2C7F26|nr:glycosyltransferase family 2 protein [Hydrogenophaga sp. NFH-34]
MTTVSVVIATYNRARYLTESVRSVLEQTLAPVEVLIADDASTDNTADVVQRLMDSDSRVRLIRLPVNAGPSAARNTALQQAQGEFIAILDSDDICLPMRLEHQSRYMQSTGTDLCGSWFEEFGHGTPRAVRWPHAEDALRAAMLFQNTICHPTMMVRRKVFDRYVYKPELRLAEDYDLVARAMAEFRIANVPEVLTRYRRHANQATMSQRMDMEEVTRRIRLEALQAQGIEASPDEQRIHNLIRAPQSVRSLDDFEQIEFWLLKLIGFLDHPDAKRTVATQWTRAAIRAAPLGWAMWRKYRSSPLHHLLNKRPTSDIDLAVLAAIRLDYRSPAFEALRRFGLSA